MFFPMVISNFFFFLNNKQTNNLAYVFRSNISYEYYLINLATNCDRRKIKRTVSYRALKPHAIHSTGHKMRRILFSGPTYLPA